MNKNWFYFFLLLRYIAWGIVGLYIVVIVGIVLVLLTKNLLFQIDFIDIFFLPEKKILAGGIIGGIAGWIWFIFQYIQATTRGKKGLEVLIEHGYHVEINAISPDIKIPFYKVNGELFYNYAPFARDMSFMLSGIKKIAKHAEHKNIVINLVDSSVKPNKLKVKILDKFNNKLDKILIIDKLGNVIKLK